MKMSGERVLRGQWPVTDPERRWTGWGGRRGGQRGQGMGQTVHYGVRSPLPALSLSISEIRKREHAPGLSLAEPFEIQSNKRNDFHFLCYVEPVSEHQKCFGSQSHLSPT